jgi:hypothetical protein
MTVIPLTYAGQPLDASAIVPLRPTGRNEPYAFLLQAHGRAIVLAADPLNRIALTDRTRRCRVSAAGPSQGANRPSGPRRCETQRLLGGAQR